jgi:anti-sigma factor RsiW
MRNMTCQELVELVSAFIDGELDPVTERRLVDHVAICDGCGNYVDQFKQTIGALGALPDDTDGTLSAGQRDTLMAEFHKRYPPPDRGTTGDAGNETRP